MDREIFINEIKDWLCQSGAVRELQTKLRKDLIDSITSKTSIRKLNVEDDKVSPCYAGLNLFIIEYLMRCNLWYTASVMAKEAQFRNHSLPEVERTSLSNLVGSSSSKSVVDSPVKFEAQEITAVLRDIAFDQEAAAGNLESLVDSFSAEYYRHRGTSVLQLSFKRLMDAYGAAAVPPLHKNIQITPAVTHTTAVQTQSPKRTASNSTQTKDNLMRELEEAREEIDRLNKEKCDLERKLQSALRNSVRMHNVRREPVVVSTVSNFDPDVDYFVSDVRSRLTELMNSNDVIMSQIG